VNGSQQPPGGNAAMTFTIKTMALSLAAATAVLCVATAADAGSPVALTNGQLDSVTGGGPFAQVSAGASASGLFVTGNTQTIATTGVADSPFDGSNAYATGTAFGMGSNGLTPGTSSANVATFTEAPGNFVYNHSTNVTVYGLGATLQFSESTSVGTFVPGLQ
jgi:hypothetical protein